MARYIVTAGYVTATTAVPGGRAAIDIPQGATLPGDVPDEEVGALLRLGHIIEVVGRTPPTLADGPVPIKADTPIEVPDGSVAELLAWIDSDQERARAALAAEAAKGDDARSTLIAALNKLIEQ